MQLWLTERGRLLPVKAHEHGLPHAEPARHGVREVVVEPGPPHGREVEVPRLVPAAGPCEGLLDQLQPRAQHLLPEVRLDLLHRLLARDELRGAGGGGNRQRAGAGAVLAAVRVRVRKCRGRLGQRSARHPVVLVVRGEPPGVSDGGRAPKEADKHDEYYHQIYQLTQQVQRLAGQLRGPDPAQVSMNTSHFKNGHLLLMDDSHAPYPSAGNVTPCGSSVGNSGFI